MNADGSGFTVLNTLRAANYGDPVWSPTGRIFFSRWDDTGLLGTICSANPDGSDLADVTVLPVRELLRPCSLSQDGRWLALFHSPNVRGPTYRVVNGNVLPVRFDGEEGLAVYMAANGHGRENVFLEARRLAELKGESRLKFRWRTVAWWFIGFPTWSPDGARIAFVGGANAGMLGIAHALYIVRVDGSGLRMVPNTDGVTDAAWRPQ